VEVSSISDWLRRYNEVFNRFQRLNNHGLYSLLAKEIQAITPLLEEGQRINASSGRLPVITQMIHDLVRPRIQHLQNTYISAQRKIAEKPDTKDLDAKIEQKWARFGLPASILENHADCARFLFESNLINSIIGYRTTCGDPTIHDVKIDVDGHPLLKVNGRWKKWEDINQELHYDAKSEKIKSRDYPGRIVQTWNYFHPLGLMPQDRFNYDQAFHVYELTQDQYDRTCQYASRFYETNAEKDVGIPKDCVVQFFTSPRRQLPEHPLLDNLNEQYPTHVAMRLITADRKVYSFGYQLLPEDAEFLTSNPMSNFLTTADAKITMLDYEEFRSHEGRIVTSIPLTAQRGQNILNYVNELNRKQLRFQYERQNCSVPALEVLKIAGYDDVDIRSNGPAFLYEALPNLNQIPKIGPLIAKIEACVQWIWEALPWIITAPIEWTKEVVLFVPKKMCIIAANFITWKMGASKKTTPLASDAEEEDLYDKKGIQSFSSVIRYWGDFFREETTAIYNAKYFIQWQKKQRSTFIEPFNGQPKLSIVPPLA
jgi:hypothetical protein